MKSVFSYRAAALTLTLLSSISVAYSAVPDEPAPKATEAAAAATAPDSTVVGNATVEGGKVLQVTLGEVKEKLKLLPPQLQNAPFKDVFPLLLKSVLTEKVVEYSADKAGLKGSPENLKMVEQCKSGVLQKMYIDKEIDKLATDEKLMASYEEVKKAAPKEDEYNLSMITVDDKQKAEKILKDLKTAGVIKFSEIANKESMNKIPGGNLGYVRLGELPEAIRDKVKNAVKATLVSSVVEIAMPNPADPSKKITTHNIVFVQDKRPATFPEFKAVREELKAAMSQKFAKEVIKALEEKAQFQMFTMDGKPMEDNKAAAPVGNKAEDAKAAAPAA